LIHEELESAALELIAIAVEIVAAKLIDDDDDDELGVAGEGLGGQGGWNEESEKEDNN
jgi:hypothetical protein